MGVVGIYAGCAPADSGRLAQVAATEVRRLIDRIEPAELARAKAQLKAGLFMGRESLAARAEQAAAQMLDFGRLLEPGEMGEAIDAVTAEDIARSAPGSLRPAPAPSAFWVPRRRWTRLRGSERRYSGRGGDWVNRRLAAQFVKGKLRKRNRKWPLTFPRRPQTKRPPHPFYTYRE